MSRSRAHLGLASVLVVFLALAFPVSGALTDGLTHVWTWENGTWAAIKGISNNAISGCGDAPALFGGVGSHSRQCKAATSDYINYATDLDGYSSYSVIAWINGTWPGQGGIISSRDGTSRQISLYAVSGAISCQIQTATSMYEAAKSTSINNRKMMVSCVWSGSKIQTWLNNSMVATTNTAGALPNTGALLYFGKEGASATYSTVKLDEVYIYNRNVSADEIVELYNSGTMYPYSTWGAGAPPALTYSVAATLVNRSKVVKANFKEGEDFRARANFTRSDGLVMTVRNCSALFYNASVETANSTSKVICTGGSCASRELTGHYNRTNASILYDALHLKACHSLGGTGTFLVRLCGSSGVTIPAAAFGTCPSSTFLFLNGSTCKGKGYFSYNISTTASFAQRINLSSLEYDAFYKTVNLSMKYNATAALWQSRFIEYYRHQANKATVSCANYSSKATADAAFTIVNVKPFVSVFGFNVGNGSDVAIGSMMEYRDGIWRLDYVAVDDDLDRVRIRLRNSTADIKTNITFGALPFMFNSTILADAGKYNISVWANDSHKNSSFVSYVFNITDTHAPVCSGLSDVEVLNQTRWSFKANCTDEYFYSLNVTCVDWKVYRGGLAVQDFVYTNNTFNVTKTQVCLYEYCDGHTDLVADLSAGVTKDSISVGKVRLEAVTPMSSITFSKQRDKVSFCASPTDTKASYVQFKVPAGCYEAKNSPYMGHLVCPAMRQWIDFSGASSVSISGGVVTAYMTKPGTACFDSIGAFNCVSGNFTVTAKHVPEGLFKLTSVNAIWLLLGLLFFSLCFLALSFRLPEVYGFVGPFLWLLTAFVAMAVYTWLAVVLFAIAIIDLFTRVARVAL